jgi:hypothetical protein
MTSLLGNKEIQFLMLLLNEEDYSPKVYSLLTNISKQFDKTCYVLLTNIYHNVKEDFKKNNLPLNKFYFIDVLSSHYKKHKSISTCSFLSDTNIQDILTATENAIKNHKCNLILFDNISHLLLHYQNFEIMKFTNVLKRESVYTNIKKIDLALRNQELLENDLNRLVNDLQLFTDKIVELK